MATETEAETGSCLCGAIKYSFTGAPINRVICHCLDCRKISGSHYADNILLNSSQLNLLSGTPTQYTVPAAPSANGPSANITSHFCAKCGTTLYRTGDAFESYVSVRLGTLDDELWMEREGKPTMELFGERRVGWLPSPLVEGVDVARGMGRMGGAVKME